MGSFSEVVVIALAVWQTVEVMHHSELFYPLRKRAIAAVDRGGAVAFFAKAFSCPFCLSHWVALFLTTWWLVGTPGSPARGLVMALAATRLANLGNDYFYELYTRTPKYDPHADTSQATESPAEAGSLPDVGS